MSQNKKVTGKKAKPIFTLKEAEKEIQKMKEAVLVMSKGVSLCLKVIEGNKTYLKKENKTDYIQ